MIIGSQYAYAGPLNYYGKRYGLPQVHSTNASFLLWMPDQYDFDHLLYVAKNYPTDHPIFKLFDKGIVLDSLDLPFFREDGVKVFLFENGKPEMNKTIESAVRGLKDQFKR
jgi:hypothetical protein